MNEIINNTFDQHVALIETVRKQMSDHIAAVSGVLINCFAEDRTLFLCGNGGSAADAQHIAAEFTGRFIRKRRPLPAVALTTDTSAMTAIGNDFGFESIFERQFRALAREGDVLLAISTSGNSPNVIKALDAAREIGCTSIALTGHDGGQMKGRADHLLVVPSTETPRIQELHIVVGHILCDLVDRHFAENHS